MALRRDQTSGAADAPVAERRPRRLLQRASFVIILMGLGALVAAFISAAMTVRYDATASVSLPDRLNPSDLIAAGIQTSFTGNDGQSLDIAAETNSIRFVGSSDDPEVAASTANAAAIAFVDGLGDVDVAVGTPATAPSDPASPRRLFNSLIGLGIGAVVGLVLQAALRPQRVDESVTYVPTWTTLDASDQTEAAAESSRPRPRGFQAAAMEAEPTWADDETHEEPANHDDLFSDPDQLVTITIPGSTISYNESAQDESPHDDDDDDDEPDASDTEPESPVNDETDAQDPTDTSEADHDSPAPREQTHETTATESESSYWSDDAYWGDTSFWGDGAQAPTTQAPANQAPANRAPAELAPDAAEAIDTPQAPEPALDVPAPSLTVGHGFRDLVDRTSANLDPLIDRFAPDDDQFEADLDSLSAGSGADADDDQLVTQIAFLGDEIATYQRRMDDERTRHRDERDQLIAEHEQEIDALRAELEEAQLENERISERRDSARSQLEDRVTELETSLAASTDELDRARRTASAASSRQYAASEDLATEIEFLRIEVERYQRTLDEERVAHSTGVAAARLENQEELDRIHREHRVTLNQLAQTNRNLLMATRNEAEAVMAELEADHQRSLDDAHQDYEQRLTDARTHHSAQLSKLEERTRSGILAEQSAEIEELQERLETALEDFRTSQRRTSELESEMASSDRRVEQAQLAHSQAERRLREEIRRLERRTEELAEVLRRTEQRLADERKRTNEVVRNLLRESASAATAADWARRSDIEVRDETDTEQRKQIDALQAQLLTLEQTAARREATLEATISELQRQLGASPNG